MTLVYIGGPTEICISASRKKSRPTHKRMSKDHVEEDLSDLGYHTLQNEENAYW